LIVTQYQDNISSTTIYSTTATPTDADLIHVITQAHGLGAKGNTQDSRGPCQ